MWINVIFVVLLPSVQVPCFFLIKKRLHWFVNNLAYVIKQILLLLYAFWFHLILGVTSLLIQIKILMSNFFRV